jgi:hypothetical protein
MSYASPNKPGERRVWGYLDHLGYSAGRIDPELLKCIHCGTPSTQWKSERCMRVVVTVVDSENA